MFWEPFFFQWHSHSMHIMYVNIQPTAL
jgi:hypothetical protein